MKPGRHGGDEAVRWTEENSAPKNRRGGGGAGGGGSIGEGGGGGKGEVARSGLKKRNIGKEGRGCGDDVYPVMP